MSLIKGIFQLFSNLTLKMFWNISFFHITINFRNGISKILVSLVKFLNYLTDLIQSVTKVSAHYQSHERYKNPFVCCCRSNFTIPNCCDCYDTVIDADDIAIKSRIEIVLIVEPTISPIIVVCFSNKKEEIIINKEETKATWAFNNQILFQLFPEHRICLPWQPVGSPGSQNARRGYIVSLSHMIFPVGFGQRNHLKFFFLLHSQI